VRKLLVGVGADVTGFDEFIRLAEHLLACTAHDAAVPILQQSLAVFLTELTSTHRLWLDSTNWTMPELVVLTKANSKALGLLVSKIEADTQFLVLQRHSALGGVGALMNTGHTGAASPNKTAEGPASLKLAVKVSTDQVVLRIGNRAKGPSFFHVAKLLADAKAGKHKSFFAQQSSASLPLFAACLSFGGIDKRGRFVDANTDTRWFDPLGGWADDFPGKYSLADTDPLVRKAVFP
jgi:hypothetical protein